MIPDTTKIVLNIFSLSHIDLKNSFKYVQKCILNCFWKFHQILQWKSPSRLSMSLISDPGVLEDKMVPETTKIAFNMFKNVFWTISASFIKFCPEKVHQDSPCPRSLTLESWRTGWFLRPLKLLLICSKMFSELFLQVSSSFTIEKSIKTLYVL